MGNLGADAVLKERYQIRSVLGRNALGITYDGTDTTSGCRVVVRELSPEGAADAGSVFLEAKKEQFVRQMQTLAEHQGLPGIVDVREVFEEQGTVYCVMEYVEGVSLENYLHGSDKKFPLKRMQELTLPVVKSLSMLHKEGVLHQNISPDNLIFTKQGVLKLIGFGCMEGQISDAGTGYVPVELYRRQQECGPTADIYSLCASIYRCITGVIPQDAYARLSDDQLRKPSQLGVEIDSGDEAALMMGLSIYAEKRFRTLDAFQNAFYHSQAAPVQAAASTPVTPVTPVQITKPEPAPQQPEQIGTIIQTTADDTGTGKQKKTKQKKEKKAGNGGMTAIAIIGGILIIGLGISAFILGKDMLPDSDNGWKAWKEEPETEESSATGETPHEEPEFAAEYEQLLAAGSYSEVFDAILALDTTDMEAEKKDALAAILSKAVEGQYAAFENRVNEDMNNGQFDSAFTAVDEELALCDRLSANSMAAQYVDRQRIEDKRTVINESRMEYLLNTAMGSAVSQGDAQKLDSVIASLQAYVDEGMMSQEELDTRKEAAYTNLVLNQIGVMGSAGTPAVEIVTYIDENLSDTGNSCSVLEYWDFYRAVAGQVAGDPTMVHPSSPSGYLLPDSSARELTEADIRHLSQDELRLAIYEIFARHGRIFQDQAVNDYFAARSWYQPSSGFDESALNAYEKFNLSQLIDYQKSRGYR